MTAPLRSRQKANQLKRKKARRSPRRSINREARNANLECISGLAYIIAQEGAAIGRIFEVGEQFRPRFFVR